MSNILFGHEWNNHKEISQTRLVELFLDLSPDRQKEVYKSLTSKRKLVLEKGYEKLRIQISKDLFERNIKHTLKPLDNFLDIKNIKTSDELLLTLGILIYDSSINHYQDKENSNSNIEPDSFNNTKEKMLTLIETLELRKRGGLPAKKDTLYSMLSELEYIAPTTSKQMIARKKKEWGEYYNFIGVGEIRTNEIVNALIERVKQTENNNIEDYKMFTVKQIEWKDWYRSTSDIAKQQAALLLIHVKRSTR